MKIIIFGGTGQVGSLLTRSFQQGGDEVVVVSRRPSKRQLGWDGRSLAVPPGALSWVSALDGADVVINLAGRSVDCRYTQANLKAMLDSRVLSTRAVGEAIAQANRPPKLWLQMSTATIYAHTYGRAHDEASGIIGGEEPGVPSYWKRSIEIATAWEREQAKASTPHTRKVCLRTAMVMSPSSGGVFDLLSKLTCARLGGALAGGQQFMSWIHGDDFCRAIAFLIEREELGGPVNLCGPRPLTQRAFMASLRRAMGIKIGLPATAWMLEIGAFFLRTDTELLLKSRRVIPGRLIEAGFEFDFPDWDAAVIDLVSSMESQTA